MQKGLLGGGPSFFPFFVGLVCGFCVEKAFGYKGFRCTIRLGSSSVLSSFVEFCFGAPWSMHLTGEIEEGSEAEAL